MDWVDWFHSLMLTHSTPEMFCELLKPSQARWDWLSWKQYRLHRSPSLSPCAFCIRSTCIQVSVVRLLQDMKHTWAHPGHCPLQKRGVRAATLEQTMAWTPHHENVKYSLLYGRKKKTVLIRSEGPALPVVFRMFCKGSFVLSSISIQCSDVAVPIVGALDSPFSWFTFFLWYLDFFPVVSFHTEQDGSSNVLSIEHIFFNGRGEILVVAVSWQVMNGKKNQQQVVKIV